MQSVQPNAEATIHNAVKTEEETHRVRLAVKQTKGNDHHYQE